MKQKLKTKQTIDEDNNLESINKKIAELKREFRNQRFNHVGNLYNILNKIVILKQATNKSYRPRSLEKEGGINLTSTQIKYIFAYQYISTYTKQKVKEGLITDAFVCHFLKLNKLLREPRWQNLLVDKIIEKKIKICEVSELKKDELKDFLLGRLRIRKDDSYFISATKSMRSIKTRLLERKHLIKNSPYKNNLINSIKGLLKIIEETQ